MKKIFVCLGLLLALYSCKSGSSGSPKGTVESFIAASREGNLENIKKYLTKSDVSLMELGEGMLAKFNPDGAKDMKEKMMKGFKEKTKDAKVDVKDEKIDGDNATVNVEFTHDGKSDTRPFSLIKEDGLWKISLLSTGMRNSGSDQKDVEETMKKMNMDSLKGVISQGMEEYGKLNQDSLKKVMQEAMKSGMKEMEKMKDSIK